MVPRILAFRPPAVVERLAPRSSACPLSARELLGPAATLGVVLPIIRAPLARIARAALVAAKELRGAVGLALPPGGAPESWFAEVTAAADEVAGGLPIVLCGEVVVRGAAATQVDRAADEAWRLLRAGITHLAIDVAAVAPGERARIVGELVSGGVGQSISVEVVVPLGEGARAGPRAAAALDELSRLGGVADLVGVRCPEPVGERETRLQAAALARTCQALAGAPVFRHGPVTAPLLDLLRGSPVRGCDDGGAVAARAAALVPPAAAGGEGAGRRASPLERAVAALSEEGGERLEALAYVEAADFLERLGARGSAPALARALERRLEQR